MAVLLLALALLLQFLPLSSADAAANPISTIAGTGTGGYSGDGGAGTSARLNLPLGIAVDAGGNVYVADSANHRVRRIGPGGNITTVAGTGTAGWNGGNRQATAARLNWPTDVAVDASGTLYIADYLNERVRKIDSSGKLVTVAGSGAAGGNGDGGPAPDGELSSPAGIAVSPSGVLYIAEYGNQKVRRVSTSGILSTLAGTGTGGYSGDGGPATSARLNLPADVAVGPAGQVYIADTANHRVRVVDTSGVISTVAGTGVAGTSGNGGPAALAQVQSPSGIEVDSVGNLLIGEYSGHVIRKVTPGGLISTVGGTGVAGFSGDGGSATLARLNTPARVALDGAGNLYIADYNNHRVRKIEALGTPDPPMITGVSPASPSSNNNPRVMGTAPAGSTINLYTNSTCTSAVAGTGPTSVFTSTGIAVSVSADTSTTFYATLTDAAAENSGCSTTSVTYLEDSTPPGAPNITSSPGAVGTDVTPTWDFAAEAGASMQCMLLRGGTTISAYSSCSGSRAYDLTAQGDGSYTFSVRANDAAGNSSPVATSDYALDTTAPGTPTITSSPGAMGTEVSPEWSFTSDVGALTSCRLQRGAAIIAAYAPCTSPRAYDLSTQPDGIYTFSVRAADPVGNTGGAASSDYELDTTAPAAPTFASTPGTTGTDSSPTWGFTGATGVGFECRLSRGATVLSGFMTCTSPETFDLSTDVDGTYALEVRSVDAVGNTSGESTSTYVLDRSAPGAPALTSGPGALGANQSPQWGFTTEAGSTAQCGMEYEGNVIQAYASCTSLFGYNLTSGDGTYTFLVRATDAAGNTGNGTSATYELDTATPGAPTITAAPPAFDSDVTPKWDFMTEPGSTIECRLERGAAVIAPYSNCNASETYDLSTEGDGTYTFLVRATDAAGNTGAPTTSTYTLDTDAPGAPAITGNPGGLGNDTTPEWSFAPEPGATVECRLMRGATMISDYAPCSNSAAYDVSSESDGTYTFSARATDAAGNTGPAATSDHTLDTSAPNAPSITAGPGATGNDVSPDWSFTVDAGDNAECRLVRGGTTISDFAACSGSASYDLSAAADGTYTFSVRATDAAGNTGPAATSDYTLDTSRPNVPTITGGPAPSGSDVSPTWSFSSSSPGSSTDCRLEKGGSVLSGYAPCLSPHSYDLSASGDGSYTFSVRAVDAGGNVSFPATIDYDLDTLAPSAPTITSSPGALGNDTTPTWSFSGEGGTTMECRMERDTTLISDWTPCSGSFTTDLTSSGDATYTFSVRATDAADNVGPVATDVYVLQATAPNTPTITSTPGALGNDNTPTWTFSVPGGTTGECRLRLGSVTVSPYAPCTSPATFDLSLEADGGYTFSVRAVDALGQAGGAANSTYVLDTTAPSAPAYTSTPGAIGNDASPRWGFTAESGSLVECRLENSSTTLSPFDACSSPRTYDVSMQPDDTFILGVRATDAAGNTGSVALSAYVLDRTAPDAPIITASPGETGSDAAPEWSFSAEPGAATQCSLVPTNAGNPQFHPCASPANFDLPNMEDRFTFLVRAVDAAGNVGPGADSDYLFVPEDEVVPPVDPPIDEPPVDDPPVDEPPVIEPNDPPFVPVAGFPPPNTPSQGRPPAPTPPLAPEFEPGDRDAVATTGPLADGFFRDNVREGTVLDDVGQVALEVLQRPAFPLILLLIVGLFLVFQNRMDKNDPKLANAPTYGTPDLEFTPAGVKAGESS